MAKILHGDTYLFNHIITIKIFILHTLFSSDFIDKMHIKINYDVSVTKGSIDSMFG